MNATWDEIANLRDEVARLERIECDLRSRVQWLERRLRGEGYEVRDYPRTQDYPDPPEEHQRLPPHVPN